MSRIFLEENRIINVEVQTGHKKELPKRSRYYQSVADVSTTSTGTKYRDLPENILIFIGTGTNQVKLCKNDNILTVSSSKSTDISTRKPSAILLEPYCNQWLTNCNPTGGGLLL
ncbi:MAG: PD-(D/E)XK nuclease family transposase [Spirochaetaceae bacterium]|nr:PD-(D/E)XK nuclease family transposase [Spirochaetaceae bacterium]